ncbi:MAG TPA: biotin carboxylase N-terminal domain-containing protein [Patescibacteria group bacterium]|nr:biotin carboxylase N-terminal domain-containing protein [Patescibacteria group bacterium]
MKVLIANRGEIALRIVTTLREMGIPSVAVHTQAESGAPHVERADESVALPGADGYLDAAALVAAARARKATAIHPGYGFLSQSPAFAEACAKAGLVFIGPSPEAMRLLGDKRSARGAAEACGVPVIPGASACDSLDDARRAAAQVGYPILIKAAGGGGGKGMRRVDAEGDLAAAFAAAGREAAAAFADARLLVEKCIAPARHVEVQILGDGKDAVALGERECSLQRRYQKVVEEAPSPGIGETTRQALLSDAARLARHAGYKSAGTVEFLVGPDGTHFFLEVNTRLQVEHPVTEWLTGLDIVAAQVLLAQGGALPAPPAPRGHAIETRLYAEDPHHGYLPSSGPIVALEWPQHPGLRIDAGIRAGSEVRPDFDPLLAKMIAWGADREQARRRLIEGLRDLTLLGVVTNQAFLIQVLESDDFRAARTFTTTLETTRWPEPPVPPEAAAAARRALASPAGTGEGDAGPADRYSPWARV